MIVVDTNLISYLLLPGVHSKLAGRVFARDREWSVPMLWRSEFRNVLAGTIRRGDLSLDAAVRIARHAEDLVRGREHFVRTEDVLRLTQQSRCTAYDCEFVAVAHQLRVSLVTSDEDVLAAYPGIAVAPDGFSGRV